MSYFIYETKNIYYQVTGHGKPLMLLHGDTASSKMFEMVLPLYSRHDSHGFSGKWEVGPGGKVSGGLVALAGNAGAFLTGAS